MADKKRRFETVYRESTLGTSTEILLDNETRVQYLLRSAGYGIAMTPLLGSDGKPLLGSCDYD